MVISDQRMPGLQGTDVLAQSRDTYPLARRVLLTAYSDIDAAVRAINVAHLDHYLSKPWDPPEECLFPVVDDLLDAGRREYLPEARDCGSSDTSGRRGRMRSRTSSPATSFPIAGSTSRGPDSKSLLDARGIRDTELPALFFEDGSALRNPEPGRRRAPRPVGCGHA